MPDTTPRPAGALAVTIPLANEEATVAATVSGVLRHLRPGDRLICVTDGASRDRTPQRVEDLAGQDSRVVHVHAPENRSVVDAYFRGYRAALGSDAEWILEMDGGGSHDPAEIPRFLQAMCGEVDFVAGSRFCEGGRYIGMGPRLLFSRGGTWLANSLLGTQMHDMTSGFEAFTREALQYVVDRGVESRAHFFQTEIRYMLHDWRWVEVPITYRNPSNSVGGGNVREALRNLWRLRQEVRAADGRGGRDVRQGARKPVP